jgi:hypothetical protein
MPSRASKPEHPEKPPRRPRDINQIAYAIVQEATGGHHAEGGVTLDSGDLGPAKNPAAVALGKLGGRKGGLARASKLSAKRRTEIAKRAAEARWKRDPGKP